MKNAFRWIVVPLLVMSFLLAACGTQPTPAPQEAQETAPTQAPVTTAEKTKVVIFIGMGTGTAPDQVTAQEELARKFNAERDDIELEFLIVPHDEAPERFLAMVAGGNAPQLVGPNGTSTIAQFLDNWEDITPYIEAENYDMSDFYGPVLSLNEFPDKNVGLPLGIYPSMIFYNKEHFDAAGLPYPTHDFTDRSWTMEKLREYAMQLTLDDNGNNATSPDFDPGKIAQWGYDDSWISGRGYLAIWGAENVGRPTTADYKTAVANSPEWVHGLQWLSDGIWVDHFIPDLAGQEVYYSVGGDPFGGQMVAMFYSHSWFFAEGLVDLPFEYGTAVLPFNHKGTRIERVHADSFTMPKDAQNKDAAWEVMKWLASPENISEVCIIYGCLPARQSVEAEFEALLIDRWPSLDLEVVYGSIEYLDDPHHESWVPEWGRVEDIINNAISEVYSGVNKDAQSVLDEANTAIQQLLDDYWKSQ